jgi:hypothetical protein
MVSISSMPVICAHDTMCVGNWSCLAHPARRSFGDDSSDCTLRRVRLLMVLVVLVRLLLAGAGLHV